MLAHKIYSKMLQKQFFGYRRNKYNGCININYF